MQNSEPITLVVATDNFYAVLLSELLKSIEVNHKTNELIHIHVIDDGISKKNIDLLTKTVDENVFTFFRHKIADFIPRNFKVPNDKSGLPVTTYLRLFAPYLIPRDKSKMLYLDVDMIVLNDISLLWNIDLGDRLLAAVQDKCKTIKSHWGGISNYEELGLNPNDKYFNAGLLLINPILWRERDISSKVIKALSDNIDSVKFADQYGLNVVLVNQWQEINLHWNAYADVVHENPYLVHYLNVKPIFRSYKSQPVYYDVFYNYLRQTPYKDFKILSGNWLLAKKLINKINKRLAQLKFTRRIGKGVSETTCDFQNIG